MSIGDLANGIMGVALAALAMYLVLTGRLVTSAHVRREKDEWTRAMAELQSRNHYVEALFAHVGSAHQRSTMKWTKGGGGWTANAMALTEPEPAPACGHLHTVDVESVVDPEVILARICTDCNEQLEPLAEQSPSEMVDEALAAEHRPLLLASTDDDSEPERCEHLEARYVTPGEAFDRVPVLVHKCFKNP